MKRTAYIVPETVVVIVDTENMMNVSYTTTTNPDTGQDEEVITSITKYYVWDEGTDGDIDVY